MKFRFHKKPAKFFTLKSSNFEECDTYRKGKFAGFTRHFILDMTINPNINGYCISLLYDQSKVTKTVSGPAVFEILQPLSVTLNVS